MRPQEKAFNPDRKPVRHRQPEAARQKGNPNGPSELSASGAGRWDERTGRWSPDRD